MKTKIIILSIVTLFFVNNIHSQNRTTVNGTNSEISDNLDLKAVASIFGDSKNLEDFENRLNDSKYKISNLDLNEDGEVDYLRVIESVEENTHLIVIQAILETDVFQDVATIEVEKDINNTLHIQVVGDIYVYGNNYIYEPVYINSPILFANFWAPDYRIYFSRWNWRIYPRFHNNWRPYAIYRYHRNVRLWINNRNHYNYVNIRRSTVAINLHRKVRANSFETSNPERSFEKRNKSVINRHDLDQNRKPNEIHRNNNNNSVSPRNNDKSSSPRENKINNLETPIKNKSETTTPRGSVNKEKSNRNPTPRKNSKPNTRQ
jgi:hypothetical protein